MSLGVLATAARNRKRKQRLKVCAIDLGLGAKIPRRFNPDSPLWGHYATLLMKLVQREWGIPQTGVCDSITLDYLYPWRVVHGIDVSIFQGNVDWPRMKALGVRFAYARAAHGLSPDASYPLHRKGAESVGIRFGAYLYAYASRSSAGAQAARFLELAKPRPGDLAPMIDVEETDGLSLAELRRWTMGAISLTEASVGGCGFYSSSSFAASLQFQRSMAAVPLWLAHYGVAHPTTPAPWHSWAVWQHIDGKNHPTHIDQDVSSSEALMHLTLKARA